MRNDSAWNGFTLTYSREVFITSEYSTNSIDATQLTARHAPNLLKLLVQVADIHGFLHVLPSGGWRSAAGHGNARGKPLRIGLLNAELAKKLLHGTSWCRRRATKIHVLCARVNVRQLGISHHAVSEERHSLNER